MSLVVTGTARVHHPLPALYATDGAAVRSKSRVTWWTGFGWIGTDGQWGSGMCPIPAVQIGREAAVVAELRAVWHVLQRLIPARPVVVVLDSKQAIRYLDAWAAGETIMPSGYVGSLTRKPMLSRLALLVAHHHQRIAWSHVKGHSGHLLNEAADSLAKIGRDWCRAAGSGSVETERAVAESRARRLVEGFLADRRLGEVA